MLLKEDAIKGKKRQWRTQKCSVKNCTKILQKEEAPVKKRGRKP
jgi:hypothetical protein